MNTLDVLIFGKGRSIDGIVPDVTISETTIDEVQVTQHPVDTGANVADHAFWKPAVLRCQFGWSDSSRVINQTLSRISNGINGNLFKALETTEEVYEELLKKLKERKPFSLKTGRREIKNVIITRMELTTNADTENALIIDITFQEIVRVNSVLTKVKKAGLIKAVNSGANTAKEVTR